MSSPAADHPHASPENKILVIDFGSQYTQLIARRVRECKVFSAILPYDSPFESIDSFQPAGIILSGGPATVTEEFTARAVPEVFEMGVPVLGICYGMQTMTAQLGGKVENALFHEYGRTTMKLIEQSELLHGLGDPSGNGSLGQMDVWMSHGDRVIELPPGFTASACSANSPYAAISDADRQLYGFQFHPEVTHTPQGKAIIERFVHRVCRCSPSWEPESIIQNQIDSIRRQVGSDRVVLALSGGVDSSVCAALLHRAIGDQLTCIFVDNGLLRLNEADTVCQTMTEKVAVNLIKVDAADRFYCELAGVSEPEEKRRIIGRVFVEIFQEEASKLSHVEWLAQGTIYPDVIESAGLKTDKAKVIKSHHNVGGLPESLHLRLLEPLRELFKDEVRTIGTELGLPHEVVYRHPFPGPGLGVRILGEVKREFADILRQADAIYIEELHRHDLYYEASQAFVVFVPVKSVGVVGDNRAYDYVVSLRAVQTQDFMTANCMEIPHPILQVIASRITNEVAGVSRVTYDITSKPPATIEWE